MTDAEGAIAYYRTASGREVDLAVGPVLPGERLELVQVCASLQSAESRERETRGLLESMAETRVDHATIVTLAERGRVESAAGPIRIVPAWEWTLEPGAR